MKMKSQKRKKEVSKERGEAVGLLAKGLRIIGELDGMGMEEKRKRKREEETVEQWEKRLREINENAVVTAIKWMIEEEEKKK